MRHNINHAFVSAKLVIYFHVNKQFNTYCTKIVQNMKNVEPNSNCNIT